MNSKLLGSKDIAQIENRSRRAVNYMKDREGFPQIEWVGRTWRVDREAYEAWKLFESGKKKSRNV